MPSKVQDDDLVMNLVELALARPPEDRERYLYSACAENTELFDEAWKLVNWEQQMNGFLLDPLYAPLSTGEAFAPGELLDGRFRVVRAIAEGGMGVVYEAWDTKLDRRIAIKAAKPGYRRRLPPEVRHASDISHPNICKTFEIHTASTDYGEVDFLTMEYIEGETLFSWLRRGRMHDDQLQTVALQLCAGLAEAHKHNVIHGDLKTGNVLLTSGPDRAIRAVITDFGLAHRPDTTVQTIQSGAQGGTPAYMAPELWKGAKPSVASDIYALGMILYEMTTGRLPLGSETAWEQRLTWKPQPVNKKLDRVLARCLDPDPAKRFQSVDEVAQALKPISRRWLVGAAAGLVLAAVTGGVTYYRATAPETTVKLAVLPIETDPQDAALGEILTRETAAQVARVKGDKHTKFMLAGAAHNASHVLHTTLHREAAKLKLHAVVTKGATRQELKPWDAEYSSAETKYIPTALAGAVTYALRLPPAENPAVNQAAYADYKDGVDRVRFDSGMDQAVTALRRAVNANPDSPLPYAALGEAEYFKFYATTDEDWFHRAEASEKESERRNPDTAAVHRLAGLLMYRLGQYEPATQEFLRAIDLQPGNSDAHRRLGLAYQFSNQPAEARTWFRAAVEVEPGYARNHTALGSFYLLSANYAEAANSYSAAVKLAPDNPDPRSGLGLAYLDLGRYRDGETELRVAAALRPDFGTLNNLGLALMYQGREREAITFYEQALRLAPGKHLSWTNLGICFRQTGEHVKAKQAFHRGLEAVDQVLSHNPKNGSARSGLAFLSVCVGDRKRAEQEITQALQLSPKDTEVLFQAAKTYEALGQRDKTLAVLTQCPDTVLADLNRWPYVPDLHRDPQFQQLLVSHHLK